MRTTPLIVTALSVVVGTGIFFSTKAPAIAATNYSSIIERIATRFGLATSDVQKIFDEERTERQVQMQKTLEERLSQAVSEGTITEAQKTAILAHHKQMQEQHEEMYSLTPEERRARMEQYHTDFLAFLKANNLTKETMQKLMVRGIEIGRKHGFVKGHWMGKNK